MGVPRMKRPGPADTEDRSGGTATAAPEARLPEPGVLRRLARVLDYPGEQTQGVCEELLQRLRARGSPAAEPLAEFASAMRRLDLSVRQELYAATFDVNPACCLYLGYHLFGDSYKRGALMSGLNGEYASAGFDPGPELPDHVCVLLRYLDERAAASAPPRRAAREETGEDVTELLELVMLPALRILAQRFEETSNPYGLPVTAALRLLAGVADGVSAARVLPVLPRRPRSANGAAVTSGRGPRSGWEIGS